MPNLIKRYFRIEPVKVDIICGNCHQSLHHSGQISLRCPPSYLHSCKCTNDHQLDKIYPAIEYIEEKNTCEHKFLGEKDETTPINSL